MIAAPVILPLTIGKSQDTDDQKEGDNHQKTNSEVIVRVLIIPATLRTTECVECMALRGLAMERALYLAKAKYMRLSRVPVRSVIV